MCSANPQLRHPDAGSQPHGHGDCCLRDVTRDGERSRSRRSGRGGVFCTGGEELANLKARVDPGVNCGQHTTSHLSRRADDVARHVLPTGRRPFSGLLATHRGLASACSGHELRLAGATE